MSAQHGTTNGTTAQGRYPSAQDRSLAAAREMLEVRLPSFNRHPPYAPTPQGT
jgi:hypothetical protein